jgi:uncharacterized protein (DUF1800 family)
MALDPREAALALHRFGFGPRAGTIAAIAPDPRGALLADLERPNAGILPTAGLMSSGEINRTTFEFNAARNAKARLEAKKEAARREAEKLAGQGTEVGMERAPAVAPPAAAATPPPETPVQANFFREAKVRYDAAIGAEVGFVERLVWFWSNHFCVNLDSTVMAGAYEREAIRPHVLGKFVDLLLAADSHPAMLIYLDNTSSMGPDSVAGINRNRGLNENLAREILELHTLGVRGGYSQADVTSFAKVITGWTIQATDSNPEHGGEFLFHPRLHEPGAQTVLGKDYRDTGVEQGRAVLKDIARHPATANHIAVKLARHFIADDPPPALVAALAQRFTETDGDLWQVSKTLVAAPESWSPEQAKIKRPGEWSMAVMRAAGLAGEVRQLAGAATRLGEPLWRPPAPRGFADDNGAWLDGLGHRLENANAFAQQRAVERLDPAAMLEAALGPLASNETRQAVARAETKAQALTLLVMASEFQRR